MNNSVISRIFRPQILEMSAYKVADSTHFIKLDAMENPYNLPDEISQQWLESLKHCALNRYPDPAAQKLTALIKQVNDIPDAFDVLLGNGSDEIIQLLLMGLQIGSTVLAPEPSFVMYKQISLSLGLNYQSVGLNEDFSLNLEAMLLAIDQHQPAVIFLAYPNNPTGNLFKTADIKKIIEKSNGLVIIDEAYAPFAEASFIDFMGDYENLLVMRTLSKLGLAGLRLGFIAGQPSIIAELDKIRLPYNINVLTQTTACFALLHYDIFEQQTQEICQQRGVVLSELNKIEGIKTYASAANFILFKTPEGLADTVFLELKVRQILIKNLSPQAGLLSDCLRVTIGTANENQLFLTTLIEIFNGQFKIK
ncbi:MAG: histidinol-phosphate transaminase [Methylococcales bacterium]|nr:histidinol-phosphate transaminase [Methylococcales bacterium]